MQYSSAITIIPVLNIEKPDVETKQVEPETEGKEEQTVKDQEKSDIQEEQVEPETEGKEEQTVNNDDKQFMTEDKKKELPTTVLGQPNQTKGLKSELKELKVIEDPRKKLEALTGVLEEQGKVPPKTSEVLHSVLEGDKKALHELCNILSVNESVNTGENACMASPDQTDTGVNPDIIEYGAAFAQIMVQMLETIVSSEK